MTVSEIIKKKRAFEPLSRSEICFLLSLHPESPQIYLAMAEADHIARKLSYSKAEIHANITLGEAALHNGSAGSYLSELNQQIRQIEIEGVNAIVIKSEEGFPFELYLDLAQEINSIRSNGTVLIADAGDLSFKDSVRLKDAGFSGVYYSLFLEKNNTKSIRNFFAAGLEVGTCIEGVGPEHSDAELAEIIEHISTLEISFCGAARRKNLQKVPAVNEFKLAQIITSIRMAMPMTVAGNCTTEPHSLTAIAGVNVFQAGIPGIVVNSKNKDGYGRKTVAACRSIFSVSNWDILNGRSRFYS